MKKISAKNICSQCKWFDVPTASSGLTCSEREDIHPDSEACKDFIVKPFDATKVKKEDAFFKEIRKKLVSNKFKIDSSLMGELKKNFIVAQSFKEGDKELRRIPVCSYGPKEAAKLMFLFEETQALRDRTLAIKLGIMSMLNEIKQIETLGRHYVYEHYGSYFSNMKSEAIREIYMSNLLDPLFEKLKEITHYIEVSNLIYDNLKDTYFTLKEIKDIACLFLVSSRMSDRG